MAFVKNSESLLDTIQVLKRDVTSMKGTITKGSKVRVFSKDAQRGYTIVDLESNEAIAECGFDIFEGK